MEEQNSPPVGKSEIFLGGYQVIASEGDKTLRRNSEQYWTVIKIEINMTCVYKEYEVKIKMVLKQLLQLKMKLSLGYNMEIVI